ncbi:MAG: polysaccharide deacetylase family protein [Steroidobacteraceae bacterium]
MVRLALKIDADTLRGTRIGVPALAAALKRAGAGATFLFSLGPDHTGRAIRRVFRPGFLGKVSRTSVIEHYGLRTLMYGTLLPGPDISRRAGEVMRSIRAAGFEVGVHCYDHTDWQDFVTRRDARWTERQMLRAAERFEQVFGERPQVHGAAGWQMNEAAFEFEQRSGLSYASDTRGAYPFRPKIAGRVSSCPQLPTTLPTLDELIGIDGISADNVDRVLLERTAEVREGHVFTLHAELEGMRLLPTFERLLSGWRAQGYELVPMASQRATLNDATLPVCEVVAGTVPGRSGTLACQVLQAA